MPRLTDKNEIRACLRRDPAWSVYALGDLAPPMFPKTLWFAPDLTSHLARISAVRARVGLQLPF